MFIITIIIIVIIIIINIIIITISKHWLGRSELVDIPSKQEFNNSKYSKTIELCTKVKRITLNNFFGVFNINFEHVMFQLLF